jgi:hypothetical protein
MNLTIDGTNYGEYIYHKKYSVNSKDLVSEWVDGNFVTHRDVYRKKVEGTVILTFTSETDMDDLLSKIEASVTHTVNLYVNNLKAYKTITAFIDTTGKIAINYEDAPGLWSITLEIEER